MSLFVQIDVYDNDVRAKFVLSGHVQTTDSHTKSVNH